MIVYQVVSTFVMGLLSLLLFGVTSLVGLIYLLGYLVNSKPEARDLVQKVGVKVGDALREGVFQRDSNAE